MSSSDVLSSEGSRCSSSLTRCVSVPHLDASVNCADHPVSPSLWQTMRYLASLTGEDGQEGHSHGHSPSHLAPASSAKSSALESTTAKKELRKRGGVAGSAESEVLVDDIVGAVKEVNPSLRLGAYLNLCESSSNEVREETCRADLVPFSPRVQSLTSPTTSPTDSPSVPRSTPRLPSERRRPSRALLTR